MTNKKYKTATSFSYYRSSMIENHRLFVKITNKSQHLFICKTILKICKNATTKNTI